MKKMIMVVLAFCVVSIVALAEMPVTTVTPDNADKQEVKFSVNIVPQQRGDLARVTLTVLSKSAKYGKIGQPGLCLYSGQKMIGFVALYIQEVKAGEPASYWCDLAKDCLDLSTITVSCYPEKPTDNVELCVQSMEYTLKLKDFMKKEGTPNKPDAGDGK